MAYVTRYNFKRIFKAIRGAKAFEGIAVSGRIYPDIDFCFFNKMEREELLQFKAFISDPDLYIERYLDYCRPEKDSIFLEDGKQPAFHNTPDCERLQSDYTGYIVPDAIRAQGAETIERFREFYRMHKSLFERDPESFEMRASIAFKTKIMMQAASSANIGVACVS